MTINEVEVLGHRVLLKPAYAEDEVISDGALEGFVMDVGEEFKRQKASTDTGTIVSIGPMAWKAFDGQDPEWKQWCEVGDEVIFAKYGGKFITIDEKDYIVVNDEDIQVKLRSKENG